MAANFRKLGGEETLFLLIGHSTRLAKDFELLLGDVKVNHYLASELFMFTK